MQVGLTDFDQIWEGNAFRSYAPVWMLKIYDFENPIWQMFFEYSKLLWCTFFWLGGVKRLLQRPATYLSNSYKYLIQIG